MMKGTSEARKALTKSIVLGLTIGMFGGFNIASAAVGDPITSGDDSGVGSVAIGDTSTATGADSVAVGGGTASGDRSLAIGSGTASGDTSLTIGNGAVADGDYSIVISNDAQGDSSVAHSKNDIIIGNHSSTCDITEEPIIGGNFIIGNGSHVTGGKYNIILGDRSTASASGGLALGTRTTVSHEWGVALGVYSATADFNRGETAQKKSVIIGNTTKTYTYAGCYLETGKLFSVVSLGDDQLKRQIQNVAAGDVTTTSTDAVNGSQLAATNQAVQDVANEIGVVNTTTNGVSNTNTVGQNIDAINNAVGDTNNYSSTNNITQGDSTVTAIGKLDDAIGTTADGEYVSGDNSVGENLNKLDDQVKTNADNIANNTTNITNIQNTVNAGYTFGGDNDSDSVALGKQVTVAGGKNISTTFSKDDATGNATITVNVKDDVAFTSVKVGANDDVIIDGNGINVDVDRGAGINVGSVRLDVDGINAGGKKISNVSAGDISATSTDAVNGSQIFNSVGDVNNYTSNNYVTNGSSLVENVSNLDQQVGTNTDNISKIGNNISGLSNKLNNLDSRVNKVGASSAALAALHPLEFDPSDKWNFAAGYGNYQGSNAMAIGAFYRPNEDTMFSLGTTLGNGENMINVGVSFKIGSGNHLYTSRTMMAKEIEELRQKDVNHMTEIEELRQQVNKLTEMISSNK